jgi:hypothetical protein
MRFGASEDDGQATGLFGADRIQRRVKFNLEHLAVEKEQRAKGLILRGGGDVAFNGQVREERFHFRAAHVLRVALVVKEDKAPDPVHVGFFGADGIVPQGDAARCLRRRTSRTLRHSSVQAWSSSFLLCSIGRSFF